VIPRRRRRPRRCTPPLLLAVLLTAVALLAPAPSGAFVVGVADQSPALFANTYFQQLAPLRTRYITAYDSIFKDPATLDAWMTAAHDADMEVVVAFNPPAGMRCPNIGHAKGCRPVSAASYRRAFRAFRKRYPWVRIFQPWNEVNNLTQPTARYPDAVVTYYQIVKANCPGCTVLGADIQDLPNMAQYATQVLRAFRAHHVPTPRVWGLHNYTDTNRFVQDRNSSMRRAASLLPGKIWLTETAGLFRFQPQNARQSFRPSLARQKRAMQAIFAQAQRYRAKVDRVYLYQWFASAPTNRWDSAILDAHGLPRPVFDVLLAHITQFR
jgi:polysaccharide biosynthesis protein PslG